MPRCSAASHPLRNLPSSASTLADTPGSPGRPGLGPGWPWTSATARAALDGLERCEPLEATDRSSSPRRLLFGSRASDLDRRKRAGGSAVSLPFWFSGREAEAELGRAKDLARCGGGGFGVCIASDACGSVAALADDECGNEARRSSLGRSWPS